MSKKVYCVSEGFEDKTENNSELNVDFSNRINERFEIAVDNFNKADLCEILWHEGYSDNHFPCDFFIFLSVGKVEASVYLADCFFGRIGINKSFPDDIIELMANLALYTGKRIGDKNSIDWIKAIIADDPSEVEIPEVAKCASVCAAIITINKQKADALRALNNLTLQHVLAFAKELDISVKNMLGTSYFECMVKVDPLIDLVYLVEENLLNGESTHHCCVIS